MYQPILFCLILVISNVILLSSAADTAGSSSGPVRRRWDSDKKYPRATRAVSAAPSARIGSPRRRFAGVDNSLPLRSISEELKMFDLYNPDTYEYAEDLDNRKAIAVLGLKTPGQQTSWLPKLSQETFNTLITTPFVPTPNYWNSADLDLGPELEKLAKIKIRAPVLQSYQSLPNPRQQQPPPKQLRRSVSNQPTAFRWTSFGNKIACRQSVKPMSPEQNLKDREAARLCLYDARKPSLPESPSSSKDSDEPEADVAPEPVPKLTEASVFDVVNEVAGRRRRLLAGVFGSRPGSR